MAIKIKNLRISPYTDKNELKVIFGDELKLTFEIPHVDGESYLCALDCDRILYPINRPVCSYTEVFTRDGDDVSFTLNLTTSKLRDYVSSIKKPMPVWLQIVREVNGKYETVLLDDILAIPSVIDGSMTVYEGDSFKELLDAKMNVPEAEGTDGQVLTMDADGHYSWQDLPEQEQADWDESDSEKASYIKNKPNLAVNDGKITVNQGGVKKGEFTVNQAGDTTIDLNDGAQSDWDESDSSNVSFIKNKPNLATVATSGSYNDLSDKPIVTQPVNADWDESDSENLAYIFNKPTIPAAQVQADYAQNDDTQIDYIKNKPEIIDATDYLCFTPVSRSALNMTVTLNAVGNAPSLNLEYSKDRHTWTSYTVGTVISLSFIAANKFESVWFRGDNSAMATGWNVCHTFALEGATFAVTGNIMSLLKKDCKLDVVPTYGFAFLFNGCANLVSAPKLPASMVGSYGYARMFQGCTSLEETPELPAIGLAQYCYGGMFNGCASLKKAHDLPATNTENVCYGGMFQGCISLKEAPVINADMYSSCSEYMFDGCTSLNHVKVNFTNFEGATNSWMSSVAASGVFECPSALNISTRGANTVPAGWTIVRTDAPQSDWNQNDSTEASFIKNKPTIPDTNDYLCFMSAVGNIELRLDINGSPDAINLEYSRDKSNWTTYAWTGTTGDTITFTNGGEKVWFRGNNSTFSTSSSNNYQFKGNGYQCKFYVTGNIMSLVDKTCASMTIPCDYCFTNLFAWGSFNIENLNLPAMTLTNHCYDRLSAYNHCGDTTPNLPATVMKEGCYHYMFQVAYGLKHAKILPATNLAKECYSQMFIGCSDLVTPPVLPATTMAQSCYYDMFQQCGKLKTAPELPATNLANNCYQYMFWSCTSLETPTKLPATTLKDSCYQNMFMDCTSLKYAPELPATTLANNCYQSMFQGCTALTNAPYLPATALVNDCYSKMFQGCSNLKYVNVSFTSWDNRTNSWLANTYSKGVINCPNALEDIRDASHIPTNWIKTPSSNTPSNETLKKPWTSSATVFTVCPQGDKMYRINVSSTLTLNAMYVWDYAYAEVVLDVAANATVTAGSNITFVDTPTAGKRNVCVVRWADQTAKLYVTITEDLDASSSI